jgi:hypothetical protein
MVTVPAVWLNTETAPAMFAPVVTHAVRLPL